MNEIPESMTDVKKILYKQLALLAEESEQRVPGVIYNDSLAMVEVINLLRDLSQ